MGRGGYGRNSDIFPSNPAPETGDGYGSGGGGSHGAGVPGALGKAGVVIVEY